MQSSESEPSGNQWRMRDKSPEFWCGRRDISNGDWGRYWGRKKVTLGSLPLIFVLFMPQIPPLPCIVIENPPNHPGNGCGSNGKENWFREVASHSPWLNWP